MKVRHPGVGERIWEDFQLLRPLAGLTSRVRSLKVRQFLISVMCGNCRCSLGVGVARRIWEDFQLLRPLAGLASRVRSFTMRVAQTPKTFCMPGMVDGSCFDQ